MYFTKITATYTAKNKALERALAFAQENDRLLIADEDIGGFLEQFKETVAGIFKQHPRCKPAEPHFYSPYISQDEYVITLASTFVMQVYKAKAVVTKVRGYYGEV